MFYLYIRQLEVKMKKAVAPFHKDHGSKTHLVTLYSEHSFSSTTTMRNSPQIWASLMPGEPPGDGIGGGHATVSENDLKEGKHAIASLSLFRQGVGPDTEKQAARSAKPRVWNGPQRKGEPDNQKRRSLKDGVDVNDEPATRLAVRNPTVGFCGRKRGGGGGLALTDKQRGASMLDDYGDNAPAIICDTCHRPLGQCWCKIMVKATVPVKVKKLSNGARKRARKAAKKLKEKQRLVVVQARDKKLAEYRRTASAPLREGALVLAAQRRGLAKDKPVENVPNIAPGFGVDEWREQD